MTQLRHHFTLSTAVAPTAKPQSVAMQASASAVCAKALIETPDGPVPAGELGIGHRIMGHDGRDHVLHWVGHAFLSQDELGQTPALRPVRIAARSMTKGAPTGDLHVSPATGLVARGPDGKKLIKAKTFADIDCATHAIPRNGIAYVHLMCDRHVILTANGVHIESFHPATLKPCHKTAGQIAGIIGVFPDLEHGIDMFGPHALPQFSWSSSS